MTSTYVRTKTEIFDASAVRSNPSSKYLEKRLVILQLSAFPLFFI